MKQYIFVDQKR